MNGVLRYLGILDACSGAGTPPRPADHGAALDRASLDLTRPLLVPFEPAGNPPPAAAFDEAQAIYEAARRSYEARDYAAAAGGFVRAASVLRIPADQPHASIAAANRAVFYEDAAYAWQMAGAEGIGRATLARLRQQGVASDDDLRPARAVLRSP